MKKYTFVPNKYIKYFTITTVVLVILLLICIMGSVLMIQTELNAQIENSDQIDYAVVLGAGLIGDQVSERLKIRLDTAYHTLKDNEVPIVVSGGKGDDELISEAEAMKRYLVEQGISASRIILEDQSTSTYENLKFSKALMPEERNAVLIITSDFHMYRAKMIGRRLGWQVQGVSAVHPKGERLKLMRREVFALIKDGLITNVLSSSYLGRDKMKTEKSCGIVVFREVDHKIEYLLLKSKKNGDWGFPKGHVEGDETEYETAKREVLEEAGIDIQIMEGFRVPIEYLVKKNVHKTVIYFVGALENQEIHIQDSEITDFVWLDLDQALENLTHDNAKDVLLKANQFLLENRT
ncbi:ElyC/SanA/YdcF family protein [Fusibacter ferrireducens]|uniref:Bis(5'-nucleosyl)-tetraphosphatase [asymmetrical] n=1 Tax=Fusibacter ferrireducens TaxID=2785058 RepID=A0ABR9ZM43_9FIRM|nr:ElyC/SanA/YdcF family protein [Fusibacter ferrireducens]MBF4691542.1 YdcF family protein [Fusibacter ferrireducens]